MPLCNQLNHQILYVKAYVMDTLCTQPEMPTVSEIGHSLVARAVFALCQCEKAETKFILRVLERHFQNPKGGNDMVIHEQSEKKY
jgi:hypothetical protein